MSVNKSFSWHAGAVSILFDIDDQGHVLLRSLHSSRYAPIRTPTNFRDSALPVVEVKLAGQGGIQGATTTRMVGSYVSRRLQYVQHEERADNSRRILDIVMRDTSAEITVISHFMAYPDLPVIRSTTTVRNDSKQTISLQQVSSMVIGGISLPSSEWWKDCRVSFANSTWFREAQWQTVPLPSVGLDDTGAADFKYDSSNECFAVSNQGTFSTGGHLPMGALTRLDDSVSWLWQIEHNGSWRWEIGDFRDSLYVAASGPLDQNHSWTKRLAPGESFTSVPAAVCLVNYKLEAAFAALTNYRRRIRRPHADHERLPIIFNDYMNCLMGDPTEDKIAALIEPAARSGAEYFVIDCGWYSEDDGWWETVGEWEPSKKRFPSGLQTTMGKIKAAGMIPGLWIEPEVIGVSSPAVDKLPREAYFERDGQRIVERDRFQLDFRHPAVIERMDKILDRLVGEFGAGYFKFDYKIGVTQGTDINSSSPGDGLLEHSRAYLAWVRKLLDRYPHVVIENCSSGAQRTDYAMLAVHPIQSTSDQQDPIRYAAIAASVPTAITPEQSATWAYPQPGWSDELNALTVVNSFLGRIHLSGPLDRLSPHQCQLITEGMNVYKSIRADLRHGVPFWPLGVPGWHDEWICLGIRSGSRRYISVWRRAGETSSITLPIREAAGIELQAECLYPTQLPSRASWDMVVGGLSVLLPAAPSARLFRLKE
jgi:alpha-galactosidase